MASTLYRAPYYFDSRALSEELRRHHIVTKRRTNGDTWTITCSCGMDTGEGSEDQALTVWTEHFSLELRKP